MLGWEVRILEIHFRIFSEKVKLHDLKTLAILWVYLDNEGPCLPSGLLPLTVHPKCGHPGIVMPYLVFDVLTPDLTGASLLPSQQLQQDHH